MGRPRPQNDLCLADCACALSDLRPRRSVVVRAGRFLHFLDEGGVFKATGRPTETRGAAEIKDTRETRVNIPIDMTRAEQIQASNWFAYLHTTAKQLTYLLAYNCQATSLLAYM